MACPQFGLIFDIGRGPVDFIEIPLILLTHGHLDHASGIPYYFSQRNLRKLPPGKLYCPPEIADPLRRMLSIWSEIEDYEIQGTIEGVDYERDYPIKGNVYFRAVRSSHRIASNGYLLFEKTKRLKEEFKKLSGPEIARLKNVRDDLFHEFDLPLVTFSGDTRIEFVAENPLVQQSKILFLECTYIDDKRPVERARQWGHTHLLEIAAHAEAFRSVEQLFLIHFSPRYRPSDVRAAVRNLLPDWLSARTVPVLPPRME